MKRKEHRSEQDKLRAAVRLLDAQDYRSEIDGAFEQAVADLGLSAEHSDDLRSRKARQDKWDRNYDSLG